MKSAILMLAGAALGLGVAYLAASFILWDLLWPLAATPEMRGAFVGCAVIGFFFGLLGGAAAAQGT